MTTENKKKRRVSKSDVDEFGIYGIDEGSRSKHLVTTMKIGNNIIEMKAGMSSLRNLRAGLMQMAFHLVEAPLYEQRSLVLVEPGITKETLAKEWGLFCKTLQPKLLARIHLIVFKNGEFFSFPGNLDPIFYSKLERQIKTGQEHVGTQMNRGASYFMIVKILIHQWLLKKGPTTVTWLANNAGCSYPTVAKILRGLGIQIERQSYRSTGLSQFPNEAFARMLMNADKDRSTARYADYSGQPFSPESYVRRLEKLKPPDLAIGGVLGARHYYPELDLVGRVLAIARLTPSRLWEAWPQVWSDCLLDCFPDRARTLAASTEAMSFDF